MLSRNTDSFQLHREIREIGIFILQPKRVPPSAADRPSGILCLCFKCGTNFLNIIIVLPYSYPRCGYTQMKLTLHTSPSIDQLAERTQQLNTF